MKKHIIIIMCMFVIMCMSGCGKENAEEKEGTKISIDGLDIVISDVQVSEDSKTVQLIATYSENGGLPENSDEVLDAIGPCQLFSLEEEKDEFVGVYRGWYNEISEIEDIQINKMGKQGFESAGVYHMERIEKIDAWKDTLEYNGVEIEVVITPFSVAVMPEEDWIGEEEYYALNAVMKNQEVKRVVCLPTMGNPMRKDDVSYLGDGMRIGMELEHGGIVFYINEDSIDIEQIEGIEIESY